MFHYHKPPTVARQVLFMKGISPMDVAKEAQCSPSFITNILSGHKKPSSKILKAIEKLVGFPAIPLFPDSPRRELSLDVRN